MFLQNSIIHCRSILKLHCIPPLQTGILSHNYWWVDNLRWCCVQLVQLIYSRYHETKTRICSISLQRSIPMIGQWSVLTISICKSEYSQLKCFWVYFLKTSSCTQWQRRHSSHHLFVEAVVYQKHLTRLFSLHLWLEVVMLTNFQKAMRFWKFLCVGALGQWEHFAAKTLFISTPALERFVACVSLVGKLRAVSAKQISIFLSEQPFVRN